MQSLFDISANFNTGYWGSLMSTTAFHCLKETACPVVMVQLTGALLYSFSLSEVAAVLLQRLGVQHIGKNSFKNISYSSCFSSEIYTFLSSSFKSEERPS